VFQKEIDKCKKSIWFFCVLIGLGAGNAAYGYCQASAFSVVSGLFCMFLSFFMVFYNIDLIERYIKTENDLRTYGKD